MSRELKNIVIEELRRDLGTLEACLLLDTSTLRVEEERELRSRLRRENIRLRRVKNTLAWKALEGSPLSRIKPYLAGPTTVAYGREGVFALPRTVADFSRKVNKRIPIKGGYFEGEVLDPAGVEAFSRLPDRRTLNGMLAGGVSATLRRMAAAVNGVGSALCRAIQARIEKSGGVPPETETPG